MIMLEYFFRITEHLLFAYRVKLTALKSDKIEVLLKHSSDALLTSHECEDGDDVFVGGDGDVLELVALFLTFPPFVPCSLTRSLHHAPPLTPRPFVFTFETGSLRFSLQRSAVVTQCVKMLTKPT